MLRSAAVDREALIFLHIPKTAGTTLNRIIERQYHPLSIFTPVDPNRIGATVERFKRFSESRRRRIRVVRGHLPYGIHEFLPQGATYVTMLREPVARFLSSYHSMLRRPLHPLHRKLKKGLSVEDLIRLTPQRQNLQCRFISGIGASGICDERVLDIAKGNLTRSFRVVGLCERFPESLLLMMASFGWEVPFYENRKVAKSRRPSVDPCVTDAVREHNRFDLELYDFAKKLFEENLRKNAPLIRDGLAALQSAPKPGSFKRFCHSAESTALYLLTKVVSEL